VKYVILVPASLAVLGLSHARAQEQKPPPAGERIEIAKRIYGEQILSAVAMSFAPPRNQGDPPVVPLWNEAMAEDLHRWSLRWMEAECDAAAAQAGRVAAAQAHLNRMTGVEAGKPRMELANHPMLKDLEEWSKEGGEIIDAGVKKYQDVNPKAAKRYMDVARYFRLEAEARLANEKAGR
jgi:hypothetical protein